MKAVNVTTAATKLCDPGHRDFIHIYNNSDTTIYVCYDGGEGAAGASLTTSNGIPIIAGGAYTLENTGPRILFNKAVYAIHGGSGNKEVRLQGVE